MNIVTTLAQSAQYYNEAAQYTQSQLTTEETTAALIIFMFVLLCISAFGVLLYIFAAFCFMRIFKKAGVAPWAAWVPIYNNWKILEIGGQQGFWAILGIIPVINIASAVFIYISMYNIGLKLGKSGSFVLLGIFLAPVWLIWLAIDKTPWNEAAGAPSLAGYPETPPNPDDTSTK